MAKRVLGQLDPDTVPKDRSVWDGIDCESFERQSRALEKKHVPGRRCYTKDIQWKSAGGPYAIPLEIEISLTDDLAFIAASQPQVESVSAVAMEQSKNDQSLVFRLAANEGVTTVVKAYFDQLFAVLNSHARKGIWSKGKRKHRFMRLTRYRDTSRSV